MDVVLERIKGTWRTDAVLLNGVEKPAYNDFTVTFSGKDTDDLIYFTTTGRPDGCDFPESGSLKLGSNIETQLLGQPDGWPISYWAHDTHLELYFTSSTSNGWDPSTWHYLLKR